MMQPVTPSTALERRDTRRQGGFVLMTVLFVLLALLVLCAPFLATARNADRASGQLADRAQARLLLDAGARHARSRLAASHPGAGDATYFFDSLEELAVDNHFEADFLDATDPQGAMWDLEVEDLSGRIDLNSASPQVLANLMGMTSRLRVVAEPNATELSVYDLDAFDGDGGFLWIAGEIVHYRSSQGQDRVLAEITRGVGTSREKDDEGQERWVSEGPRPPATHGPGTHVLDQRAFAPVIWRISGGDDRPRRFDTFEQLREADLFALAGGLGDTALLYLADLASVHGGVRAGSVWQRPVRLVRAVEGGVDQEIVVDHSRWLNEGATVWIGDGQHAELRYVQRRTREGEIVLNRVLEEDYDAWDTEVRVLARRPVNLNTASGPVLVALFQNLKLRDRNARITAGEARDLADLVLASRPFTGFEDWLRRVVLPAAGIEPLPVDAPVVPDALVTGAGTGGEAQIIDPEDALALYANGLNANDASLAYATMPFCFSSRDVYAMQLRAVLNAPSGIERARALRDRVELVVPQRELFSMWSTQEDFDEALRLHRSASWWASGPNATSRFDRGAVPPSRLWAHLGTLEDRVYLPGYHDGMSDDRGQQRRAEHVFASRDETAWVQLWPSRIPEQGRFAGRTLHFDHETRDLEGRYLPDETLLRSCGEDLVQWAEEDEANLMRPMSFSLWVKPTLMGDGLLLDVGGSSREADRASLRLEGDDLVLRVLDGFGDHPATDFREATEARFGLALSDTGPGLPVDTWSHLEVDVAGTRPDQVGLLVNGLTRGVRRLGITRLTQPAGQGDGLLVVESTEGFPPRGVARLGDELVEYVLGGSTSLAVGHQDSGPDAGFGGRLARTRWTVEGLPANLADIPTDHPAGTTVSVYGYSAPLASNLPAGGSALSAELGPFRVARVISVDPEGGPPDPITAGIYYWGTGYEATNTSGLTLALADAPDGGSTPGVMEAFNPHGGYAALVQQRWAADETGRSSTPPNAPLGGVELIRYSGYDGDVLRVAARGDAVASELARYGGLDPDGFMGGTRVFVIDWETTVTTGGNLVQALMDMGMYVVPISIHVPGADALRFLPPGPEDSEFAQLTRTDAAELTEWVRYDTIQISHGQLVRDHPDALLAVYVTLTGGGVTDDLTGRDQPGGGGGGQGGGTGDGGPGNDPGNGPGSGGVTAPAPPPTPGAGVPSSDWDPLLGESELDALPLTRAVWSAFQFRGVLGTHTHTHPSGTTVLPVFHLLDGGPDRGRPGARDPVFVSGPEPDHLGWPLVVHRAHLPAAAHRVSAWQQDPGGGQVALDGGQGETGQDGFQWFHILVALQEPCPEPIPQGGPSGLGSTETDPRLLARLTRFPSGERPRIVDRVAVGGAYDGSGGEVPSAVVDEVVFGAPEFLFGATGALPASHTQGASLVLTQALGEAGSDLRVAPSSFRVPGGLWGAPGSLGQLPADAGLLRIGDEILCYSDRDVSSGVVVLASGGRGLLGTRPQIHAVGEPLTFLEHRVVTVLTANTGPDDSFLAVASLNDFPTRGTVLVGDELIHYTRHRAGALEMPRASSEPGARDGKGRGLFRGRFGTQPGAHPAGTPVILFPFRYWDRWAEAADAPEMSYYGLELAQPGAFWQGVFWDDEPAPHGQCRIGVLQRSDPSIPWDEDPDLTGGLILMWEGRHEDGEIPIGVQSDMLQWRVFVRYDPGAFDPIQGMGHGWKETPRLQRLGTSYFAPGRVLRSVDR